MAAASSRWSSTFHSAALLRRRSRSTSELSFGIGMSVLVPWLETNRPHRPIHFVESEDGGDPLISAESAIEVGRPPDTPEGSGLRTVLAVSATIPLPRAGGYRLGAHMGPERRWYGFRVVDQFQPPARQAGSCPAVESLRR